MPLRSTISSLAEPAAPGEMPAAPTPRLGRRPGIYKSPAGAVDVLSTDEAEGAANQTPERGEAPPETPAPTPAKVRVARKPRAAKVETKVAKEETTDVQATRLLLGSVESDIVDLRTQMQKALAKFQPKLERLQARHAELSASLVKQLTQ